MIQIEYKIENASGLHARPASVLVKEASAHQADIMLVKNDKKVNCKSIMGILSAGIKQGDEVKFEIEGEDETTVSERFKAFLNDSFKTV